MQFLYPGLLWGLLATAIPVVIHLFNFRRTKKVFFSNVKFLRAVETETSSFRKVKQWLIMAARMLFIAALILAFAQPFFPAKNGAKTSVGVTINSLYLDNSLSMQHTTENKRFIDLAVIKIDELLSLFKQSPTVQLLKNDFSADDQDVTNATRIKDRLTSIQFSANPRTFEDIARRQKSLTAKHNASASANLFWFSDFQKSTAGDLKKIKIDSADKLFIVPVRGEVSQNIFVDSVWLASPFVREMQNNILYAKIYNSGQKAVEKFPIRLFLDGIQSSTASISVQPNASAIASFNFTVQNKGVHKGKISFDDQPIVFDNEYFFVLDASPAVNVLHLFQQKSGGDYIRKIFDNDSLFTYRSQTALNVDAGAISTSQLVVLEGVTQIEGALRTSLEQFVRSGGSLFVVPPSNPNEASYKAFLANFGIQNIALKKEPPLAQNQLPIQEPTRQQPFYADVFEQSSIKSNVTTPTAQPVWNWTAMGEALLKFRNTQLFLSKTTVSQGTVYVLASPLDAAYGNFAEHAFYVPTLFKMAALSLKAERAAYNFSEGSIQLYMPDAPKNATYKLKNGNFEIIPIQRVAGNTVTLELPKSSELNDNQQLTSGYYELTIDGKTKKTLAINHDNEESLMDYYSTDELKSIFENQPNVTVFDDMMNGDFVKSFAENNIGTSLWKYFLYAALAFLLAEILLVRFLKG